MILATFTRDGGPPRIGLVDRERGTIIDLQTAHQQTRGRENQILQSMLALIESGSEGLGLVAELGSHLRIHIGGGRDESEAHSRFRSRLIWAWERLANSDGRMARSST